jgi:hypothetical protein
MDTKQAILNQINLMKQINATELNTNFNIEIEDETFNVYISITGNYQDDEL